MRALIILFILFNVVTSVASPECKGRKLLVSPEASLREIKLKLDNYKREQIVQMAWGEMFVTPQKSKALPILQYLVGSENDTLMRGYYKALGSMLTNGKTPEEAIQQWPKREGFLASKLKLKELCELYSKTESEAKKTK